MSEDTKNPAAVTLGRLGGRATKGVKSIARMVAARRNGLLGGRPRRVSPVSAAHVPAEHPPRDQ
jgi:hypothetical protein